MTATHVTTRVPHFNLGIGNAVSPFLHINTTPITIFTHQHNTQRRGRARAPVTAEGATDTAAAGAVSKKNETGPDSQETRTGAGNHEEVMRAKSSY